jgi:hypothetical protein
MGNSKILLQLSGELKAAQYSIQDLEKKVSVIQCRRRNSQEVNVPASQAIVEEFNAKVNISKSCIMNLDYKCLFMHSLYVAV